MISPKYLAGYFDGDGCISMVKEKSNGSSHGYNHRLICTFTYTNNQILEYIKYSYGGYICKRIHGGKMKNSYSLCLKDSKAKNLIEEIYNYSLLKKDRIALALSFFSTKMGERKKITKEKFNQREDIRKRIKITVKEL